MNRIPPFAEGEPPAKTRFWEKTLWVAFAVVVFMIAFVTAALATLILAVMIPIIKRLMAGVN